jgi:hypothetical protein
MKHRIAVTAVAALVLAGIALAYFRLTGDEPAEAVATAGSVTLDPGLRLLTVTNRHLSAVSLANPGGARTVSDVECVRAYAAAGTGVCLRAQNPWSYELVVLDTSLHESIVVDVPGLPNRARVSPSGRMVAWTTFVGGDSYASGGFSTRTGILDTRTGERINTLEGFAVTLDGRPYQSADVNFWGVTFADDNRFYASMSTAGRRYLMQG